LAAIENGGRVVEVSDQFFGPPSNMLLPGRGVHMGDGWETLRRRTPGSDWAVISLARRGIVDRIELDTHFFKGNAPQAVVIEALDELRLGANELMARLRTPKGWNVLLGKTSLVQHHRHQFTPDRPQEVTHVRVHIFPHGGVNRLRLYGNAVDTPSEQELLVRVNQLSERDSARFFEKLCGSKAFAQTATELRPYSSVRQLFHSAEQIWWNLQTQDWLEAFAAHPRIGGGKGKKAGSTEKREQAGVNQAGLQTKKRLSQLNDEYFKKHGFIFIIFASGKSAQTMLESLEERVKNPKRVEIENAAAEQARITRKRLEQWLLQG
jgi:allantoicase